MSSMGILVIAVGVALGSAFGVLIVRLYASRRLLDFPGERSSHSRPTPRGGGLALCCTHVGGLLFAAALGAVDANLVLALVPGGIAVALIGFLDDHGHVNALVRLLVHLIALWVALVWIDESRRVGVEWNVFGSGQIGFLLLLLFLAWFLNLFNFMDGIDGLAGSQALFMAVGGASLSSLGGAAVSDVSPLLLLAASTAGFLVWNWPPARIFMGDVGSGYVGFALGVLALWTVVQGWLNPWVWVILGGAFLADATTTLVVRAVARMRLTEAHRSHAYQRLSRHWKGHRRVTLAFLAINVGWLGPWALVAARWPGFALQCAAISVAPLFVVALALGAGQPGEIGSKG